MKLFIFLILFTQAPILLIAQENVYAIPKSKVPNKKLLEFINLNKDNNTPSVSIGTVSNGSLKNGKLVPFSGKNFQYFDTSSYVNGRAFVNNKLKKTLIDTYRILDSILPERKFQIMECSNKEGGKISPHRTHQNGLSVDFMMPLVKNNKPCYNLDSLGANHYWLDFDNNGQYLKDKNISIDFNTLATYILTLNNCARKNGLKISKVILKLEFKPYLYSTESGKIIKNKGLYFATKLTPLINSLHDDHFHVDFELVK